VSGMTPHNRWRYPTGTRSLPIKYLYGNKEILEDVVGKHPTFLTHGGIYVNLPAKIGEDLAYLCGLICGDGNLFTSKKRDYLVAIHNKETELLRKSIAIIEKNFNYKTKIKLGHGCWKVEARSEVIHSFFNKILEIENGKKENIKIPDRIKANRKLVRSFIAGFFDAEGCVALKKNKITCQISISQKQKGILEEIRSELIEEGVETKFCKWSIKSGEMWSLYGNRDSLAPFLEKIPFIHPKKKEKLETAVKNQISLYNRESVSGSSKSPIACFSSSKS